MGRKNLYSKDDVNCALQNVVLYKSQLQRNIHTDCTVPSTQGNFISCQT
jgi:hypothetical protein